MPRRRALQEEETLTVRKVFRGLLLAGLVAGATGALAGQADRSVRFVNRTGSPVIQLSTRRALSAEPLSPRGALGAGKARMLVFPGQGCPWTWRASFADGGHLEGDVDVCTTAVVLVDFDERGAPMCPGDVRCRKPKKPPRPAAKH